MSKTEIRYCEVCNAEFKAKLTEVRRGYGRFCSLSCSSSRQRVKHEPNVVCAQCRCDFYKSEARQKASKSGLFFCSRACKDKAQKIGGIEEIQPSHYGSTVKDYRAVAFRNYPHRCNDCGWDEYPEVLQVHHHDRDRSNNQLENLVILCPTCHVKEHFLAGDGFWSRLES